MASKIQLEVLFSKTLKKVEYIHICNIYGNFLATIINISGFKQKFQTIDNPLR